MKMLGKTVRRQLRIPKQPSKRLLKAIRMSLLSCSTQAGLACLFSASHNRISSDIARPPGLPTDASNAAGITPLSEAAAAGQAETAKLLLERKAGPQEALLGLRPARIRRQRWV